MKTAIVTGPTRGIGREVAIGLAKMGYHVIAAGRPSPMMEETTRLLEGAGGSVTAYPLDLASLASCRDAARAIESDGVSVDVVVNNAGVGPTTRGLTTDGFEVHFGVNHLGHFAFTHHLRRTFRPGTRIVQVTSSLHDVDGIDFDRVRRRTRSLSGIEEYSVSKLANLLFVAELARRQPDWRAYAVHPGFTDTDIIPWFAKPFVANRLIPPADGARTIIWCAVAPELADESGRYYSRMAPATPRPAADDERLAGELWVRSEKWCGVAPQNG